MPVPYRTGKRPAAVNDRASPILAWGIHKQEDYTMMTQAERYRAAKERYAEIGVDTEAAIAKLKSCLLYTSPPMSAHRAETGPPAGS